MEQESDFKNRVIRSFFWKFLERAGSQVMQLAVQIVLARLLMPEDFGVLAIMIVFVNIANAIAESGLTTALVQNKAVNLEDYSTVFWMSLLLAVVIYIIIFLNADLLGKFYKLPEIGAYLKVLSIVVLVRVYPSVQQAEAQRKLQYEKIFKSTITGVVISGIVGIFLAFNGYGIWALVFQQITFSVGIGFSFFLQNKWYPKFYFNLKRAKELYSFAWKLLASSVMNTIYDSLSDLVIGKQFNAVNLGMVSQGKKYPSALGLMLDGSIQPVMLSTVSKIQHDKLRVKNLVRRGLKTSTFVIFPAMALFAVIAKPIVLVLLGEKWLPSVPYLQMYCFIMALLPIHSTNLQAINGMGRSDIFLKLEVIKKIYGIIALYIGAFVFKSIDAIVISYMITGVISTFVNAHPSKKVINYNYLEQIRDTMPSFSLAIICALITLPLGKIAFSPIFVIVIQVLVYAISYLGIAYIVKLEELVYLITSAKKIIMKKLG